MAVRSINGKNSVQAYSPDTAAGTIKVPRVVILDSTDIYMNGLSGKKLSQRLQEFAPMCAEKIDGTTDDYVLNMSGFSD